MATIPATTDPYDEIRRQLGLARGGTPPTSAPSPQKPPMTIAPDPYRDIRKRLGLNVSPHPLATPTTAPGGLFSGFPAGLHTVAQDAATVQRLAANLPGVRQIGDIGRATSQAVGSAPVVDPETGVPAGTTYGETVRGVQQVVADHPAVHW